MIPKVIHYCWFGGNPLPKLAHKCIASWHKYFPDYEVKLWDEENFDVNIIPYVAEAYKAKKYAFVSDYARFWVLYNYGGYYFDTDVEIVASMDEINERGPFMAAQNHSDADVGLQVNPGLGLSSEAGDEILKAILDYYGELHFSLDMNNLMTIVEHTTNVLRGFGLRNVDEIQKVGNFHIYQKAYFNPINQDGHILEMKPETVAIHHYAASWMPWTERFKRKVGKLVGPRITEFIIKMKRKLLK